MGMTFRLCKSSVAGIDRVKEVSRGMIVFGQEKLPTQSDNPILKEIPQPGDRDYALDSNSHGVLKHGVNLLPALSVPRVP